MPITRRELLKLAALSALHSAHAGAGSAFFSPSAEPISESAISQFRKHFGGDVLRSGDAAYESARMVASFNSTTDRHPRLIARCSSETDIIRAVTFANEHSLDIAVRAGGFDVLGASVCDGIVIDLSQLKRIDIDRNQGVAHVQAGVRSGELGNEADAQGFAPVLGCHPSIGVTGLTLGGGLGWLAGKYGAACDNLIAANVVTARGSTLRASTTENQDLFWAIKGGGGNFGIVSSLELCLHPLDRVFGGVAAYRGDIASFLRFYRDFMKDAPDELTVELNLRQLKVPTILATACWSGDAAEGARALRPLREYGPPVADAMSNVPYSHLIDRPGPEFGRRIFGDGPPPPVPTTQSGPWHDYWRGGSLSELSDEAAEHIVSAVLSAPAGWSIGLGHFIHGRVSRVTEAESSFPRRLDQLTYFFDVGWRDPGLANTAISWVEASLAAMKPYSSASTYINYLSSDKPAAVQASYGANYQRLAAIKRKYDPHNVFHHNRNIRPL